MGSFAFMSNDGDVELHSGGKLPKGSKFLIGPGIHISLNQEPQAPMEIRAARLASSTTKKERSNAI